jgi:prepilin-type N-terminal cleavage/methylation domain-containing protein
MRQGFTLTEMLVAVGAMALLALGVAQVFSLTTRTVAAGRRLSNLNAVASATERQMRADFASLTSRGPLVIRNQMLNNGAAIDAYPADPQPRPRRGDEIIFAASGQFTSLQQPVTAQGTPVTAPEAFVYYGHGARQDPLGAGNSGFSTPVNIADTNASAPPLGVNTGPGGSKVNQYAAEWTLVRRAFVMSPPSTMTQRIIPPGQGFTAAFTFDTATEIAGVPAVPSPNRSDANNWNSYSLSTPSLRGAVIPTLSSGVVDIIAMDLRAVAAQLADVNTLTFTSFGDPFAMAATSNQMPVGLNASGGASMQAQQAWMRGLLPADSDAGRRIRVETTVPDFLNFNGGAATPVQKADQLMLTSGAFLPRCSEFIVEYSFGAAHSNTIGPPADIGAVYWHGLERVTGINPAVNDYGKRVVRYRDWVTANNGTPLAQAVRRRDPSSLPSSDRAVARVVYLQPDLIDPEFINPWGSGAAWNSSPTTVYAMFGLNDPLYAPKTTLLAKDVNGNGQYDWADGDVLQEPESLPWARPTMIRITFTLCDPTDPSIEQTFQFVFDLPKDARGSSM